MEVISTRVHGYLDYLAAALLLGLPFFVTWDATVEMLLMMAGVGLLVVSLITRYELGLVKLLPMKLHLLLDGLLGLIFLGAAFLLDDIGGAAHTMLIVLGLLELGAALLTEREWPDAETVTEAGVRSH